MTAHPMSFYRDPLQALLAVEEQTCKGCRWRRMIDSTLQCTNPRNPEPLATVRCTDYEERE